MNTLFSLIPVPSLCIDLNIGLKILHIKYIKYISRKPTICMSNFMYDPHLYIFHSGPNRQQSYLENNLFSIRWPKDYINLQNHIIPDSHKLCRESTGILHLHTSCTRASLATRHTYHNPCIFLSYMYSCLYSLETNWPWLLVQTTCTLHIYYLSCYHLPPR